MANYNNGYRYNVSPKQSNGFNYNSAIYRVVFKLSEEIKMNDNVHDLISQFVLREYAKWLDETQLNVFWNFTGNMIFEDGKPQLSVLFDLFEQLNLKDTISDLLVSAMINENLNFAEELNSLADIFATENISIKDIADLEALVKTVDGFSIEEKSQIEVLARLFEQLNIIDKEPRQSISDLYIARSADGSRDVLLPFGFSVDWKQTLINFMPEAKETIVEIEGNDGEIVESTVYSSRPMEVVCYSDDGLTSIQKEQLKTKIANTLNLIKENQKKFTIGTAGISFDVKLSGSANASSHNGSFVKLNLPLKSTSSYGYDEFEQVQNGSGIYVNKGIKSIGARFEILGSADNISISVNNQLMKYNLPILQGEKLIIDCEKFSCNIVGTNGIERNAMTDFNRAFPKFPVGGSTIEISPTIEEKTTVYWRELFLWGNNNETF